MDQIPLAALRACPTSVSIHARNGVSRRRDATSTRHTIVQFRLPRHGSRSHALAMFVVSEAQAGIIHTAFEQRGELSAVVALGLSAW